MNAGAAAATGRTRSFRIVEPELAGSAFTGTGARLYGGRWNSMGTPMVYTAGSVSLAILEWRVHLAQWPPPPVVIIEVEFDANSVWIPPVLPRRWKHYPSLPATAAFGDAWINSRRSLVMRVPSAVVASEWNYLINPVHPEFSKLKTGKPKLLNPDLRLGPLSSLEKP